MINTQNREEVIQAYNDVFLPARNNKHAEWSGDLNKCEEGTTSVQYEADTMLQAMNSTWR